VKTTGSRRIAERYVKALFDVAKSAGALDTVEKDMRALDQALSESADFRHFLTNPLLSREAQMAALKAILAKMKAQEVTRQFMHMLAAQKRLGVLPEIIAGFDRKLAAERDEMQGELISAGPLKAAEAKHIAERLSKLVGKKVKLELRQDAGLLGGVVIKMGSQQLDGSLAGKLNRLANTLKTA
jgi:F-type H+-transporting ATPase subunit delta